MDMVGIFFFGGSKAIRLPQCKRLRARWSGEGFKNAQCCTSKSTPPFPSSLPDMDFFGLFSHHGCYNMDPAAPSSPPSPAALLAQKTATASRVLSLVSLTSL